MESVGTSTQKTSAVSSAKVLGVHFNQSHTSFTVTTERGYILYLTNPLKKMSECDLGGGVSIAAQMYETNFFGLVGGGKSPAFPTCKFVLWDDFKQCAVTEEVMKDRILAVKINHNVVAIVTRKNAKLYSIKNMEKMYKVKTASNPTGMCALSSSKGSYFLAPGVTPGDVVMLDYETGVQRTFAGCHEHPLRCIAINTTFEEPDKAHKDGDRYFATASEHGTLVKIFDITTGKKVDEFRRGSDSSTIYSIDFSRDFKCIAVTSAKGTVHVFSLSKDYGNVGSRMNFLSSVVGYLDSQWSPFSIDFGSAVRQIGARSSSNTTATTELSGVSAGDQIRAVTHHQACVTPIAPTGKHDKANDAYNLLIVADDGTYAVHDLQFKNTIATPKVCGKITEI